MTIKDYVNRVRRILKHKPVASLTDTGGHWDVAAILDIYNDEADMFVEETRCLQGTSTDSLVDSQREYDVPSTAGEVLGVWFDSKPLTGVDVNEIDFVTKNQAWRTTESSEPQAWYLSETTDKIGILDTPSADDTDALTIWHTIIPDHFTTASTATTEILNAKSSLKAYHSALVYLGAAQCEDQDGNSEKATAYRRIGERLQNKLKRKVKYNKRALTSILTERNPSRPFGQRYWTD